MKAVDWAKGAAVAEILSAIAIVVTLIYLGVQTNQNTDALLSSTRQSSLDAELGLIYQIIDRPHLYASVLPEELVSQYGRDELVQQIATSVAFFRIRENLWLQHQNGAIDSGLWEPYRTALLRRLERSDLARVAWEIHAEELNPQFRQEIESLSSF